MLRPLTLLDVLDLDQWPATSRPAHLLDLDQWPAPSRDVVNKRMRAVGRSDTREAKHKHHGYRLSECESEVTKGTTFTIDIQTAVAIWRRLTKTT